MDNHAHSNLFERKIYEEENSLISNQKRMQPVTSSIVFLGYLRKKKTRTYKLKC
jgi:hypothetical protein